MAEEVKPVIETLDVNGDMLPFEATVATKGKKAKDEEGNEIPPTPFLVPHKWSLETYEKVWGKEKLIADIIEPRLRPLCKYWTEQATIAGEFVAAKFTDLLIRLTTRQAGIKALQSQILGLVAELVVLEPGTPEHQSIMDKITLLNSEVQQRIQQAEDAEGEAATAPSPAQA